MKFGIIFEQGPEESYSRHLDKEVAAQEYPYGRSYDFGFIENKQHISEVERENARGGEDVFKRKRK